MNAHLKTYRGLTMGLLATSALLIAAPALAGHGRRYKGVTYTSPVQRVVVRERSSDAGPVLAGLIGGFILGAALTSDAHPIVVHERHYRRPVVVVRYYDPYDDVWFDSLDDCEIRYHRHRRHHPRVVHVIDTRSGHRLRTLRFDDGRWQRWDGDDDLDDRRSGDRRERYVSRGDD